MDQSLAEIERPRQRLVQLSIRLRSHIDLRHRQLDRVLLESRQPRPFGSGEAGPVHAQCLESLLRRPFRQIGVVALTREHQRRQQGDALAFEILEQFRGDGGGALRLDRQIAVRAVLSSQLDVQQSQEVVDLRERRHRAFASASACTLLDGHRGRDSENRIDIRSGRRLHELARVGVQRFEVTALPLIEKNIERERRLPRAGNACHHSELVTRDLHVDALQVVLPRVVDHDRVLITRLIAAIGRRRLRHASEGHVRDGLVECIRGRLVSGKRTLVGRKRLSRERSGMCGHLGGSTGADDLTALVATVRSQIDDPVRRADHVEVVFDHEQRMARRQQFAERPEKLRDVVEMQPRRRLIKQEQLAVMRGARGHRSGFGQVTGQLQTLRLASGKSRYGLSQLDVFEPDVCERRQTRCDFL